MISVVLPTISVPAVSGMVTGELVIVKSEHGEKLHIVLNGELTPVAPDVRVKPEPSRLEIAAMILNGWASNPNVSSLRCGPDERPPRSALRVADALIAAAKEARQ